MDWKSKEIVGQNKSSKISKNSVWFLSKWKWQNKNSLQHSVAIFSVEKLSITLKDKSKNLRKYLENADDIQNHDFKEILDDIKQIHPCPRCMYWLVLSMWNVTSSYCKSLVTKQISKEVQEKKEGRMHLEYVEREYENSIFHIYNLQTLSIRLGASVLCNNYW